MSPHVLLIGGHGKVALFMTPRLLSRGWKVTSMIRDAGQKQDILDAGTTAQSPDSLNVLVSSVEDVKNDEDASKLLSTVKPNYVIWSAGAGGKGGAPRTDAVDRAAATAFINASAAEDSGVSKFLMVSYVGSRRNRASWWSNEEWKDTQDVNNGVLANYYKAKIVADEALAAQARARGSGFQAICLRPGQLTDDPATGKVQLGKTAARGKISREDVADAAVRLLERDDTRGWIDLLQGEADLSEAIEKIVKEKIDAMDGE